MNKTDLEDSVWSWWSCICISGVLCPVSVANLQHAQNLIGCLRLGREGGGAKYGSNQDQINDPITCRFTGTKGVITILKSHFFVCGLVVSTIISQRAHHNSLSHSSPGVLWACLSPLPSGHPPSSPGGLREQGGPELSHCTPTYMCVCLGKCSWHEVKQRQG